MTVRVSMIGEPPRAVKPTRRQNTEARLQLAWLPGSRTRRLFSLESRMIEHVRSWIDAADRIVVLTGAGISTESGIPDFRGPQGVWTKNPAAEKTATLQYYVSDPDVRRLAWKNRVESEMWSAKPNAGHYALAELEQRAELHLLVTQNVDGLHIAAGTSPERIVEIHGTVHGVKCL